MLHVETVERYTLALLKELMATEELQDFVLVGGTALSLRYGHRKSIDLDLFSQTEFDNQSLKDSLGTLFSNFKSGSNNKAPGVFAYFDDVKVDFVKYHRFKNIRPVAIVDGIRLVSSEDIAAMKVFAMMQRAKKKDFWDISLLLDVFGVQSIIDFYFEKFPDNQTLITIPQVLLFFEDAELDDDPVSLKGQTWESVKTNIQTHVNQYLK